MKFQFCEEQGVSTFLNYNFKLHVHADIHIMTTGSFLEKKTPLKQCILHLYSFHKCICGSANFDIIFPFEI